LVNCANVLEFGVTIVNKPLKQKERTTAGQRAAKAGRASFSSLQPMPFQRRKAFGVNKQSLFFRAAV
jgi:hypothetical protein